jgi:hypothetical protein
MKHIALLKRRAQSAVQAVFEVELPTPAHHMSKQITIKCGVIVEEGVQLKRSLGSD